MPPPKQEPVTPGCVGPAAGFAPLELVPALVRLTGVVHHVSGRVCMGSSGEGRRYTSDDRAAAAVLSGLVWGGVTVLPFAALMTVLDALHPMLVVAWVLL